MENNGRNMEGVERNDVFTAFFNDLRKPVKLWKKLKFIFFPTLCDNLVYRVYLVQEEHQQHRAVDTFAIYSVRNRTSKRLLKSKKSRQRRNSLEKLAKYSNWWS